MLVRMVSGGVARGVILIVMCWASGCDCVSAADDDDDSREADAATEQDATVPDATTADGGAADAGPSRDAGGSDAGDDGGVENDGGEDGGAGEYEALRLDETADARSPCAAMDGDGNGTVVFTDDGEVVTKRWESAAWGHLEFFGVGSTPRADFNASGEGVAAWRNDEVFMAVRRSGAGWLAVEQIGSHGGTMGPVAIDGAGKIVALFGFGQKDRFRVQSARFEPATGWTDAAPVEPFEIVTRFPDLDANEAGDFVGAWTHLVGDRGDMETSWWSRERDGWQEPAQIGRQESTIGLRVSVNETGSALIVWTAVENLVGGLYAAWLPPGGALGDIEYVAPREGGSYAVDTAANGHAFVARDADSDLLVFRYDPAQGWEAPVVVDVLDSAVNDVSIAADGSGHAIATWTQTDAGIEQVWAARFVADAGWLEPVSVSGPNDGEVDEPSLALAPNGTALIAWEFDSEDGASEVWARILAP